MIHIKQYKKPGQNVDVHEILQEALQAEHSIGWKRSRHTGNLGNAISSALNKQSGHLERAFSG